MFWEIKKDFLLFIEFSKFKPIIICQSNKDFCRVLSNLVFIQVVRFSMFQKIVHQKYSICHKSEKVVARDPHKLREARRQHSGCFVKESFNEEVLVTGLNVSQSFFMQLHSQSSQVLASPLNRTHWSLSHSFIHHSVKTSFSSFSSFWLHNASLLRSQIPFLSTPQQFHFKCQSHEWVVPQFF